MEAVSVNDSEYESFRQHPVKEYDPHYTRDHDNFHYAWNNFKERLQRELIDALHLGNFRTVGKIHEVYYDTIRKIERYERATNNVLISYRNSSGHLRQNRSVLNDLYGCIPRDIGIR